MGAICHITPVLNDILDLCRFDLMYLTPPTKISQDAFRHITPQPFNQSASSHSRHNRNHVLPKRSTMLKSISCLAEKKRGPRPETLDCTPPDYIMPGSKERPLLPLHPVDKDMKVTNIFLLSLKCLKKMFRNCQQLK